MIPEANFKGVKYMITKSNAKKILNAALATGGDFAEIFLEDTKGSSIVYEKDVVEQANKTNTYGAGIRILKGLQSVYGYTNDVTIEGLETLATNLSYRYEGKRVMRAKDFVIDQTPSVHKFVKYGSKFSNAKRVNLAKKAFKAMKKTSKLISTATASVIETIQNVTIINSDGLWTSDLRVRVRLGLLAIAAKNGQMETAFEGPGALSGFEYFDTINTIDIAKKVAKSALTALKAKECPSRKMDVIIDNGFGGVIFHESCGHSLEATSVAKDLSVFCGKKGQKIANEIVNAVDDGTIVNAWGSGKVDDEGHVTQRNVLIKDGVLVNYLVDAQNGRRMKDVANGCSRRQNYKYAPTSRMSNTFILAGKSTKDEIIQATKKGLYCAKMGGGSVNPVTGEFNFSVAEAYLVKDGKIRKPVKGATLVGSGSEILMNIDMIGDNLDRAQGMCGSQSGSIPADVGQPCIRVRNITVGGRGK